jgi:hypothetical protein
MKGVKPQFYCSGNIGTSIDERYLQGCLSSICVSYFKKIFKEPSFNAVNVNLGLPEKDFWWKMKLTAVF